MEAYEWEVLQGATATLAKTNNLIIELHPESDTVTQSANLLKKAGFGLFDVHGNAWKTGPALRRTNVWGVERVQHSRFAGYLSQDTDPYRNLGTEVSIQLSACGSRGFGRAGGLACKAAKITPITTTLLWKCWGSDVRSIGFYSASIA